MRTRIGRGTTKPKNNMKAKLYSLSLLAALSLATSASAISIVGALSSFDINNDTGESCDEFELISSNTTPAQILGTWNYNPHYGIPDVTNAGTDVRIHYVSTNSNITAPGAIEHFGAILQAFPTNGVVYTWMRAGSYVGVSRQLPAPFVTIVTVPPSPTNPDGHSRHREIRNTDRTNTYWVQ